MKIITYYGVQLELPDWVHWIAVDYDYEIVIAADKLEMDDNTNSGKLYWMHDDEHKEDEYYFGYIDEMEGFDENEEGFTAKKSLINIEEHGYLHLPNLEKL